jgi:hypothetical protein
MGITAESDRLHLLLTVITAAALAFGCADGTSLQSPAGPSDLPTLTTLQATGASDTAFASQSGESGTLEKGGRGNGGGKKSDDEGDDDDRRGRSHEDRVVGFVTAKSGDTLTVRGVSVVAGTGAIIRHGSRTLTMADIEVGNHIQARGTMDGTKLVATEIKVQDTRRGDDNDDDDDDDDADEDEFEGSISNLSSTSSCPAVTFNIGSTKITTSSTTSYDEVTCATLANGMQVEVDGNKQGDGSIAATRIERK